MRLLLTLSTLVLTLGCSSSDDAETNAQPDAAGSSPDTAQTGTDNTDGTDGTDASQNTDASDNTVPFDSGLDKTLELGAMSADQATTFCDAMVELYKEPTYVSDAKDTGCKQVAVAAAFAELDRDDTADGVAVCNGSLATCLADAPEPSETAKAQCEGITGGFVGGTCTATVSDLEACVRDSFNGQRRSPAK